MAKYGLLLEAFTHDRKHELRLYPQSFARHLPRQIKSKQEQIVADRLICSSQFPLERVKQSFQAGGFRRGVLTARRMSNLVPGLVPHLISPVLSRFVASLISSLPASFKAR